MNSVMIYVWVGMMVASAVLEVVTFRMYFLFLSIGALLSSVAAVFGQPLWVQIVILVAVTGLGILIVRPIIKKKFESKIKKAEEDILKESEEDILKEPEEGHNENSSKQGMPEETEKE